MRKRRIRIAATVFCCASLALVAGCGGTSPTPNAIATPEATSPSPPAGLSDEALAAWTKWQEQGIDDYAYDIRVRCFCALLPDEHVAVSGNSVTIDAPKNVNHMVQSVVGQHALTADGLFEWIAVVQHKADRVTLKFDEATGFPTSITVDYALNASDDEMYVTTHDLQT